MGVRKRKGGVVGLLKSPGKPIAFGQLGSYWVDGLPRTLLLAVRFSVDGAGDWWDNNGGENFRIVLGPSPAERNESTVGGGHCKPPSLQFESARQPLAVPCSADNAHA
jgi:hypothetical protein